jgi:hypothetical protein
VFSIANRIDPSRRPRYEVSLVAPAAGPVVTSSGVGLVAPRGLAQATGPVDTLVNEGHARAAEAGIACLLRRTYKYPSEPAPVGRYDFLTYFECADADVPTFHAVCAALRDVRRNPEWTFVREGPTWQGRRVATWAELFA